MTDVSVQQGGSEDLREGARGMQRERLLDAAAHVLAEQGTRGTTIGLVAKRADMSPSTFRKLFANMDECLVALVEKVTTHSTMLMSQAFEAAETWQDGVLASLEALLEYLDSEPVLGRVCVVEALAAPPAALGRRARLLEPLKPLLDQARQELPADRQPPSATAAATVAAVAGILHTQVVEGHAPPFIVLLGELNGVVVSPYFGVSAATKATELGSARARMLARSVLVRPEQVVAPIPREVRHASAYRIRLCLVYVGENPGVSNKAIAAGIDMDHHGQISRALARLRQLGLLTMESGGFGRPNAWWLSPDGERVLQALDSR